MSETKRKERMLVVCRNSNGEPDVFPTMVECTEDELHDGEADLVAQHLAESAGYYGPLTVLDRTSPGWDVLRRIFEQPESVEVEDLASVFAARLKVALGVLMPAVIWLNERNRERLSESCASHDFCDANMYMLAALSELTGVSADNIDVNDYIGVVNEAWALARRKHFWLPRSDCIINIAR